VITTVVGTGTAGSGGDGGAARTAQRATPRSLALAPDGSLYIGQDAAHRVRRVGPDGVITTVAGRAAAPVPSQPRPPRSTIDPSTTSTPAGIGSRRGSSVVLVEGWIQRRRSVRGTWAITWTATHESSAPVQSGNRVMDVRVDWSRRNVRCRSDRWKPARPLPL
jgi:hypothetical protein